MILYPAIDIRGGQAVRLLQGDYERETAYDADPVDAATRWAGEGAEFLHVVDLDGAKAGEPRNLEAVARIAAAVECPIQVGGGLREMASAGRGPGGRRGPGRDRHRGIARPGASRRGAGEARRARGRLRRRPRRQGLALRLDRGDRPRRGGDGGGARRARRRPLPLHGDRRRRNDGGTGPARAGTDRQRDRRPRSSPPVASASWPTSRPSPWPEPLAPNIEGAIVGRALYEQKFTVAEGIVHPTLRPMAPESESSPASTSTPAASSRAPTSSACVTPATRSSWPSATTPRGPTS